MAGRIINNTPVGASDWTNEVETKNIVKKGLFNMAFTNFETSVEPEILAGSSVDVNGVIIVFDSNETITGTAPTTTGYIVVGSDGIASYSSEEPVFDNDKLGYYVAGGQRAVLSYSGVFSDKFNMINIENFLKLNTKEITSKEITTETITSNTMNTGQGDNELYAMDQNVKKQDSVTFYNLNVNHEILPTKTGTGEWTIAQVVPRGLYNVHFTPNSSGRVGIIDKRNGLGYEIINSDTERGGSFFSDGVDVSAYFAGTGGKITWFKY